LKKDLLPLNLALGYLTVMALITYPLTLPFDAGFQIPVPNIVLSLPWIFITYRIGPVAGIMASAVINATIIYAISRAVRRGSSPLR
jgi:hypothetical protein